MAGCLDNHCECRQCSGGDDGFRCRQVRFQSFDLEAGGSRYAGVNAENYRMGPPRHESFLRSAVASTASTAKSGV